jgi:hypothetical protein
MRPRPTVCVAAGQRQGSTRGLCARPTQQHQQAQAVDVRELLLLLDQPLGTFRLNESNSLLSLDPTMPVFGPPRCHRPLLSRPPSTSTTAPIDGLSSLSSASFIAPGTPTALPAPSSTSTPRPSTPETTLHHHPPRTYLQLLSTTAASPCLPAFTANLTVTLCSEGPLRANRRRR